MSTAAEFSGTSRYAILRRLGAGGMGVVYEALDKERDMRVALKTLRSLDSSSLLRFKGEFRALADIGHKNLVTLFDLVADAGTWFFTMELLAGTNFLSWVRPGVVSESISDASGAATIAKRIADTLPAASDPSGSVLGAEQRGTLDVARLRPALSELAQGLAALHAAGKVHRDIKPTNVIVTADGRVVLVDFGLATDSVTAGPLSGEAIVGTVAYMAPEQAAGKKVGPEADWYAVGVMLYEALTGELPFQGSAYEVLASKPHRVTTKPSEIDPSVPPDLEALCMDLLSPEPWSRPNDGAVLARLGAARPHASLTPPPLATTTFVGRAKELSVLERAYEDVRRGTGVTVYVHGESGVGKTSLVRHFTQSLEKRPDTLVLAGRCYERESMPFKAIDGVIDALGRHMMRLGKGEASAIMPVQAGLLAQAFPVLERFVPPLAHEREVDDASARRVRVLAALRETFQRLAARTCVALCIDDLQWADADSLLLLREIMRPPDAPSLLLLATVRTAGTGAAAVASIPMSRLNVGSSSMPGDVRIVPIERLPPDDARALASALFRKAREADGTSVGADLAARAVAIAEETSGHPLFIDELVRHALGDGPATSRLKLDEALWTRIDALEPSQRALVEIACLAGTPIPHPAAMRAASLVDQVVYDRLVSALRGAHLLRTTQSRGQASIEPYHDRVRQALLEHMPLRSEETHARIAAALLETGTSDFELVSQQTKAAGDRAGASKYAALAAERAAGVLAFDRAARLFQESIDLGEPTGEEARTRFTQLGEVLVAAGRGADAAAAFSKAAEHASPEDAADLTMRAGTQLLVSGHVDSGLAALQSVLPGLDLPLPQASQRASLLYHRTRLAIRGYSFSPKPEHEIPKRTLRRIDACFALASGLGLIDTMRAIEFQARGLLMALSAGEPLRVTRGMTFEVGFVATRGHASRPKWTKILEQTRAILAPLGDAYASALVTAAEGVAEALCGSWKRSYELCDAAATTIRGQPASAWELDTTVIYAMRSLQMMGSVSELAKRVREHLHDADTRGDLFLSTNLRVGNMVFAWLAEDDVTSAQDGIDAAMRHWSGRGRTQHLLETVSRANIELYTGDGRAANLRVEREWAELEKRFLSVEIQAVTLRALRARTAIAWAKDDASRRRTLLESAAREANHVASSGAPWALGEAALLRGAIAEVQGDAARALVSYEHAREELFACNMHLHANVAKMRAGALMGGDAGATAAKEALAWTADQGIVRADRLANVLAPSR